MTNKEIKQICIEEQEKQGGDNYPKWKFSIKQTQKYVRIYWEYLDGECWTISKQYEIARNEHGEVMNEYFDFDDTLEEVIKSSIYYMVTRY